MSNPLVSIVICCCNRADLLPQTMASVFAQQYKPVEIVVVDDGSTDNTPKLMRDFGDKVRYYWQENKGVAVTRSAGCRLARGEFIAFQDDDDLMAPDRIVQLYEALRLHPSAVLAVGDCAGIDEDGKLTGQRSRFQIPKQGDGIVFIKDGYRAVLWPQVDPKPHATLFRRVYGDQIGWFDRRFFHACEDTDFFARIASLGSLVYTPRVVSYYRRGHDSLTSKNILLGYSQFLLFEKHLGFIGDEQSELRKRFQLRLLRAMKKMAFYQSKGMEIPDSIASDYLDRGLALLDIGSRLQYKWSVLFKFPIRKVMRKVLPGLDWI